MTLLIPRGSEGKFQCIKYREINNYVAEYLRIRHESFLVRDYLPRRNHGRSTHPHQSEKKFNGLNNAAVNYRDYSMIEQPDNMPVLIIK